MVNQQTNNTGMNTTTSTMRNPYGIRYQEDDGCPDPHVVDELLTKHSETIDQLLTMVRATQQLTAQYGMELLRTDVLRSENNGGCEIADLSIDPTSVQFELWLLHETPDTEEWVRIPVKLDSKGAMRLRCA